jgi:hypothetical protein
LGGISRLLKNGHLLRSAHLYIAAYGKVRLIPHDFACLASDPF